MLIGQPVLKFNCFKIMMLQYFYSNIHSLFHSSLHPSLPVMATASGQRHFPVPNYGSAGEDDSESSDTETVTDNSLSLWWTGAE